MVSHSTWKVPIFIANVLKGWTAELKVSLNNGMARRRGVSVGKAEKIGLSPHSINIGSEAMVRLAELT